MKIKALLLEAAKMAGDDKMTQHDPQQYLAWLQEFCLWVVDKVSTEHFGDLIKESSSITLTAASDECTVPTDFGGKIVSATRDTKLCDIIPDPVAFEELYRNSTFLLKPSDDNPICCLWEEKIKVLPVGKTGNSAVIVWYIKTIGDDLDDDIPFSIRLKPAAVSFVASRVLSAESDEEGIEAGRLRLEEAGLLLAV